MNDIIHVKIKYIIQTSKQVATIQYATLWGDLDSECERLLE